MHAFINIVSHQQNTSRSHAFINNTSSLNSFLYVGNKTAKKIKDVHTLLIIIVIIITYYYYCPNANVNCGDDRLVVVKRKFSICFYFVFLQLSAQRNFTIFTGLFSLLSFFNVNCRIVIKIQVHWNVLRDDGLQCEGYCVPSALRLACRTTYESRRKWWTRMQFSSTLPWGSILVSWYIFLSCCVQLKHNYSPLKRFGCVDKIAFFVLVLPCMHFLKLVNKTDIHNQ